MNEIIKKRFFTQLTTTQLYLMVGNFFLIFFLIFLSNLGVLPLKNISDFLFFTFLFLFFALYRPGWAFLFFVGTIALENVNLAPVSLGIAMRPYQLSGGLIILAVLIRLIAQRLNFKLEKLRWFDISLFILAAAGFLSSLGAADMTQSLKLSIILSSFVGLYLLARNYVRDLNDLKKIIPFFLSLSVVIIFYGIWQNIRFSWGFNSFEVMPGRPNGTFAEADWLGIYLVLLISVVYTIIFCVKNKSVDTESKFKVQSSKFKVSVQNLKLFFLYVYLVLSFTLLIITVSRSAWLGYAVATFIFLFLILTNLKLNPKFWQWKNFGINLSGIIISGIIAVAVVYFFNLTSFQLFNRAESTGTGLQKITISCKKDASVPEKVGTSEELITYGCRHINLEEIKLEEARGYFIKETYRSDPNVNIRREIYAKSWQAIKKNPVLGIGWGNIGKVLGTDERGASLNASNIFLEVWLGTGMIGFLAFLAVWVYILIRVVLTHIKADNFEEKAFTIFVISTWLGLTVSNLFNSGIMLGFFWLFMAISFIDLPHAQHRN